MGFKPEPPSGFSLFLFLFLIAIYCHFLYLVLPAALSGLYMSLPWAAAGSTLPTQAPGSRACYGGWLTALSEGWVVATAWGPCQNDTHPLSTETLCLICTCDQINTGYIAEFSLYVYGLTAQCCWALKVTCSNPGTMAHQLCDSQPNHLVHTNFYPHPMVGVLIPAS